MSEFSAVAIIFNPNSTGDSEEEARALAEQLQAKGIHVDLTPTEHAGHAIDLAYEVAKKSPRPLIISSSGDGGYNEVINGALKAQLEGATPTCAVLPTGNANDHSHSVGDRPLVDAIADADTQYIDVLRAEIATGNSSRVRFSHSYIGLGLTPTVAVELNKNSLDRVKETWIVYKTLRDLQPVEIIVGKRHLKIDSLVLANIKRMAKVLTIAEDATPTDGRMQLTIFPYKKKAHLLYRLVKAIVSGVHGKTRTRYQFTAVKAMVMQCDGEVEELQANDVVTVTVLPSALRTLH